MSDQLTRQLRGRHIQLIAIGGTIGVGLFLGSAKAIQRAGPGLLLSYVVAGAAVFFIMRALGELLVRRPVSGALAVLAEEFVSPFAGFATAWSYWFMWAVAGMVEITAIGIYVHYWAPAIPQWVSALCVLLLLYGSNLFAVKVFGETEFWFALIKVATIVLLIVAGLFILTTGISKLGPTAGFSNLWTHGGFFPFGILGVLLTLQIVTFAYNGIEVVAMTAAEAQNPQVVIPRAINSITYRILIFYIGALIIIMSLIPWNQLDPATSPFVVVFERLGIPGAGHVINFVVITAAASSCNSGLYTTGRFLFFLAQRGQAPRALAHLSRNHVPVRGVTVSAAIMLIGVGLNAIVPEKAFTWVTSISLIGTLWTWSMIILAHLNYRRAIAAGREPASGFPMPGAPWANWLVLMFLLGVSVMLAFDADTRVAFYVAPFWFAILGIAYKRWKSAHAVAPAQQ
jgi:AAT family amino acid transporter/D-serine/D-alanine/glycine transporter